MELLDFYGRFAISWDSSSSSTRLKDWLDQGDLNPNTLDALQNVLATNNEVLEESLSLFPNPSNGILQVKLSNAVGELKYDVFNVLGQILISGKLNNYSIDLSYLPNDIYFS